MLGSCAAAFDALSRQPSLSLLEDPELEVKCGLVMNRLSRASTEYKHPLRMQWTLAPNLISDDNLLVSTAACHSICTALVYLTRLDKLPYYHSLTSTILFEQLKEILQGHPQEDELRSLLGAGGNSQEVTSPAAAGPDLVQDLGVNDEVKDDSVNRKVTAGAKQKRWPQRLGVTRLRFRR